MQGRGLEEKEARRLLQQLLVALQFVHDKGIANRDIKVCFTRPTPTIPPRPSLDPSPSTGMCDHESRACQY